MEEIKINADDYTSCGLGDIYYGLLSFISNYITQNYNPMEVFENDESKYAIAQTTMKNALKEVLDFFKKEGEIDLPKLGKTIKLNELTYADQQMLEKIFKEYLILKLDSKFKELEDNSSKTVDHVNEKIIMLQHFFETDNRIKKEMYNCAPLDYIDENSLCKYTDELEQSIKYMISELRSVSMELFGEKDAIIDKINSLEEKMVKDFIECGIDNNKLKSFYQKYISNMEPSFIDAVKDNCVGYKLATNLPINEANSINEILHLIHSYIINNDRLLQSIPVVDEKMNNYNYPIVLRGLSTDLNKKIYENFPDDLDVGYTDIVGLNDDKILMMVRDRGHALTLELTTKDDITRIEYFIPKICNVDMVNSLPGVNKVNLNSAGATGAMEIDTNTLTETLYSFISKVPTDSDMNTIYREK